MTQHPAVAVDVSGIDPVLPTDCRACGACCFSPADAYVRVTGSDWSRLGEHAERVAHFIGHRAFMRMRDGRCIALAVTAHAGGKQSYHCTLYNVRPQTCRELGRGSPACLAEIAIKRGRGSADFQSAQSRGGRYELPKDEAGWKPALPARLHRSDPNALTLPSADRG